MMKRYLLITILGFGCLIFWIPVAAAQPANDLCVNATAFSGSFPETISGSTTAATFDGAPFCGTSNTTAGVWYTVVGTGNVFIASTCNDADYDTKISVFSGSCGSLTCVTGLDDSFPECGGFTTELDWQTTSGEVYYILVHGFGSATGDFNLTVREPSPNDDVCMAESVSFSTAGNVIPFDNTFATVQPGEVSPGPGTDPEAGSCNSQDGWCSFEMDVQNSLWYSFEAPTTGSVTIEAGPFDTQLALWDAEDCSDFSTFTLIAANDDSGPVFAAAIIEADGLNPGQTYLIQLDGFAGASGPGELILITENTPPIAQCQDVTASANANCEAQTSVDAGSFDPDGEPDIQSITQVPGGPYPLGVTPVVLTITDVSGESDSCTATVTVLDDTPPVVSCSATRKGGGDDDDEGKYRISFDASDNCVDPSVTAVIDIGCSQIEVRNGQIIEVECDDDDCEYEIDDGILEIESKTAQFKVTATDDAGNTATCKEGLCRGKDNGDDDDRDDRKLRKRRGGDDDDERKNRKRRKRSKRSGGDDD